MHFKSNQGYSLVETLVAVAIVASIATVVANMNNFSTTGQKTNYKRVCESVANSALAVIQERGPIETIVPFNGFAGTQMTTYATGNPRGINAATDLFTSGNTASFFTILSTATPTQSPQLNNYQQIRGSIRTLTSIYNNTPALRCAWTAFNPISGNLNLNQVDLPVSLANLAPTVQLSLVPFDTTTGAEVACPTELHIAPPPRSPNTIDDAYFAGSGSQAVADDFVGAPAVTAGLSIVRRTTAGGITASNIRGIIMKSRVSFNVQSLDGGAGENISCETSQRFQYSADRTAPAAPTVTIANNATINVPTTDSCNILPASTRQATITIAAAAGAEEGVRLICRDLSARREYTLPPNSTSGLGMPANSIPCIIRNGTVDTSGLEQNLVRPAPASAYPNSGFSLRGQNLGEVWRPCEQVRVCGVAPQAPPAGTPSNLTLTYNDLPLGCLIHMEARAVDTAGNLSPSGLINAPSLAAGYPGLSDSREIKKPVCGANAGNPYWVANQGTFCHPSSAGDVGTYYNVGAGAANFPNGYYTCRNAAGFGATNGGPTGCCVGTGCTPFN